MNIEHAQYQISQISAVTTLLLESDLSTKHPTAYDAITLIHDRLKTVEDTLNEDKKGL